MSCACIVCGTGVIGDFGDKASQLLDVEVVSREQQRGVGLHLPQHLLVEQAVRWDHKSTSCAVVCACVCVCVCVCVCGCGCGCRAVVRCWCERVSYLLIMAVITK